MDAATLSPSPTHAPRSQRRALVQFSLRELLLLTLVAALALTIWRTAPRRLEPTPFMAQFDIERLMGPPYERVGPRDIVSWEWKLKFTEQEQVVLGGEADRLAVKRSALVKFEGRVGAPAEMLFLMQGRVKARIRAAGCEIVREMPGKWPQSVGFVYHYRHGATQGIIDIDVVTHGRELRVLALIHEFRGR